jgi:hypothetical protein
MNADGHVGRSGMSNHVGQRFLNHSIHGDRDRGREPTGNGSFERDAEAPALPPEALGKEFERGRQAQVIEDRRTQLMSHVPDLVLDTGE